jgi:Type IV secretion system pilin
MGMLHFFRINKYMSKILPRFASIPAALLGLCTATIAHASFYTGGGINAGITAATGISGVGTNTPAATINNVISVATSYVSTLALAVIVIAGFYLILGLGNETSKETAKKIILYTAVGIAIISLAQYIVDLFQALPTGNDVTTTFLLRPKIVLIINLVFKYVAMILLVVIFIAGLIMLTSGGDEGRRDSARKIIVYAIIGTVIIVFARAITIAIVNIFS